MTNSGDEEKIRIRELASKGDVQSLMTINICSKIFGVLIGDRIRLDHITPNFTNLRPGDVGTVRDFWIEHETTVTCCRMHVYWDRGFLFSLLPRKDRFTRI